MLFRNETVKTNEMFKSSVFLSNFYNIWPDLICSLEDFDCYSLQDTDKFIHDQWVTLRVSNLTSIVLFCFLQPDEKTYIFSLMKFHSMPWWHWMEVKKIFRVLVFDWMTRSNKQQTSSFLISTPTSLILIPLPTSSGTPAPLHHCATWTYLYIYGGSVCEVEYQGQ